MANRLTSLSAAELEAFFSLIVRLFSDYRSNAYIYLTNASGCKISMELDWYYAGEEKDITIYFSDGTDVRVNFLAGFNNFKGSLWHEYKGIVDAFIMAIESGKCENENRNILEAAGLVDEIYSFVN